MKKAKLLSPAGSIESLQAAIKNGADCCYLGFGDSNMRKNAKNFTERKFIEAIDILHDNGLEGYMTLNTIYFDREIDAIKRQLDVAKANNVDAVICWDPAVIALAKERELEFHISTQASISNIHSAKFYKDLGAKCVVLARECTMKDLVEIRKNVDIDIEVFIHGAMCVAVSGRCFMSQFTSGHSANRGDCHQPCRYPYEVVGTNNDINLTLQNSNVMSPKDLCTMPFIDKLLMAGASKLKIEGRARGPEYVAVTTAAYRKAIDLFYEKQLTQSIQNDLTTELKTVFNREFSNGFFMGQPMNDWSKDGNFATQNKFQVGIIEKVYPKINVIEVAVQANPLTIGDKVLVTGERCGAYMFNLESMQVNHENITIAEKGISVGIKVENAADLRANDKVYTLKSIFED